MTRYNRTVALILILLGSLADAVASPAQELGLQAMHGKAPDITIEDLHGNTVKLSNYLGHPIVLHFWATWCTSCTRELPELAALSRVWEQDGIVFFAISVDDRDKKQKIEHFMRDLQPGLMAWLPKDSARAAQYWAWGVPMTYFINARGENVARRMGAQNWSKIPAAKLSAFFQNLK